VPPNNPFDLLWPQRDRFAAWLSARLVNRSDRYGYYRTDHYVDHRGEPHFDVTPQTSRCGPCRGSILSHVAGSLTIGCHSTSEAGTCKWVALDFDNHGDDRQLAERNFTAAQRRYELLHRLGFRALLIDSNRAGGFHLLVLFTEPIASEKAYQFARWVAAGWQDDGLPREPEAYPKQPRLDADQVGNWLRAPGRHPKRGCWFRVWNGEAWLDGTPALEHLLTHQGDDPTLIPAEVFVVEVPPPRPAVAKTNDTLRRVPDNQRLRRARGYLRKFAPAVEGERNLRAYKLAATLFGSFHLTAAEVREYVTAWNDGNAPPLPEDELTAVIDSAERRNRGIEFADRANLNVLESACSLSSVVPVLSHTDESEQAGSKTVQPTQPSQPHTRCRCSNPYREWMEGWGKHDGTEGVFGLACRKSSCPGCWRNRLADERAAVEAVLLQHHGQVVIWRGAKADWSAVRMRLARTSPGEVLYRAVRYPDGRMFVLAVGAVSPVGMAGVQVVDSATAIQLHASALSLLPPRIPKGHRPFSASRNWPAQPVEVKEKVGGFHRRGQPALSTDDIEELAESLLGLTPDRDRFAGENVVASSTFDMRGIDPERRAEFRERVFNPHKFVTTPAAFEPSSCNPDNPLTRDLTVDPPGA
jgi:hypothetical protein